MAGNCRSIKKERKKRKTTVSRQKSQVSFLFFFFWTAVPGHEHINFSFPVLNGSYRPWTYIIILLFLFWMAVTSREQISFTSAFISLLFLFSFHNKNVMFWKLTKWIYFQFNEKQNNLTFYFRFIFNTK